MSEKKSGIHKVEFAKLADGGIEARYFDQAKDASRHAWTLPDSTAGALVSWWKKIKQDKWKLPSIREKIGSCEFAAHTANYIDIEESFTPYSPAKNFWTLSIDTVEELVNWTEKRA